MLGMAGRGFVVADGAAGFGVGLAGEGGAAFAGGLVGAGFIGEGDATFAVGLVGERACGFVVEGAPCAGEEGRCELSSLRPLAGFACVFGACSRQAMLNGLLDVGRRLCHSFLEGREGRMLCDSSRVEQGRTWTQRPLEKDAIWCGRAN